MTPAVTMLSGMKHISDWREVNKKKTQAYTSRNQNLNQQNQTWSPPTRGELKINVDASVFEGEDSFTIGMVLRNHQGHFIKGKTMRLAGRVSVLEAESSAILEGLMWSQEFRANYIIIESDSKLSVDAIGKPGDNRLELGNIMKQYRDIIRSRCGLSVDFVRKRANRVTHRLARIPCELNSFIVISSPPVFMLETLLSDISMI